MSWPDLIVDDTGRLTTAFQVQQRTPQDVTSSLWSADVPTSPGDPRLVRGGEQGFPVMSDPDLIRQLGSDAAGTQTFAWEEEVDSSETYNVMVATRAPGGDWSAPVTVNRAAAFITDVHLAVNAAGAAVLTWNRDVDSVIAAYRPAGTAVWLPATELGHRSGVFTEDGIDDAGTATVVNDTRAGVLVHRFQPASGWGPARKISVGTLPAGASDLAVSPNGAAAVTWEQAQRGSRAAAHYTRRMTAAGQWLPAVRRRGGNRVVDDALAIDGRGVAVAAWWTGGHDVVAQTSRPDGSWRHRVILAHAQRGPELFTLSVAMNPRGDTLVVWKAMRGNDQRLRARYRPAGGAWAPVRRLTPTGVHANIWTTAIGSDGTAAVGWMRGARVEARQLSVC